MKTEITTPPAHQTAEPDAPLRDAASDGGSTAPARIDRQGEASAAGPDETAPGARPPSPPAAAGPADPVPAAPSAGTDEAGEAPDYSALVLPDGYASGDPLMDRALALFGEHRLPAAVAQALVDFAAERDGEVVRSQAEAQARALAQAQAQAHAQAWSDVVGGWQRSLRADLDASTEFTGAAHGGDRLKEMQSLAARAIDAYGGPDAAALREHLATYALGDHPAFARFLARAGRSVREDRLPRSGDGGGRLGVAETLYPNQGKE